MNQMIMQRFVFVAILSLATIVAHADSSDEDDKLHPLAIHMKHWISGSGQWRAPNAQYDASAEEMTIGWIKEFGVNWKWGPYKQHLIGEIIAITADGQVLPSSIMYAFYNPITEEVLQVQVAKNGILSLTDEQARLEPTRYGEPEVADSLDFLINGEVEVLRHSNVFVDKSTQLSNVYERDENGDWQLSREWRWTQIAEE